MDTRCCRNSSGTAPWASWMTKWRLKRTLGLMITPHSYFAQSADVSTVWPGVSTDSGNAQSKYKNPKLWDIQSKYNVPRCILEVKLVYRDPISVKTTIVWRIIVYFTNCLWVYYYLRELSLQASDSVCSLQITSHHNAALLDLVSNFARALPTRCRS